MQCLFQQFRDFYEKKLDQVDEKWSGTSASKEEIQELKIGILRAYIEDLAKQNLDLIETAEELQKETENRVALMEKLLQKTTIVSKAYMYKIHDYQQQLQKYNAEKQKATSLLQALQSKCQLAEEDRNLLRDQNTNLTQDVSSLIHLISQSCSTSNWESTSEYCEGNSENNLSLVDRLSSSDSCFVRHSPTEVHCKDCSFSSEDFSKVSPYYGPPRKDSTPSLSLSCLSYDGVYSQVARPTEKDVTIKKLQVDLMYAQKAQRDASMRLLEKDHTIAALQCQITELRHEMSVKEYECEGHLQRIQRSQDQQRVASIEISRYDETVRQLQLQLEGNNFVTDKSSCILNGAIKHKLSSADSAAVEHPIKTACVSATQTTNLDRVCQLNGAINGSSGELSLDHVNITPYRISDVKDAEDSVNSYKISTLSDSNSVDNKFDSSAQTCAIVVRNTEKLKAFQDLKKQLEKEVCETSSLRKCIANRDEKILQLQYKLDTIQNPVELCENADQDVKEDKTLAMLNEELLLVRQERDSHKLELSKLQEELSSVEAAAQETRAILAREIAERHDMIKALRQELADQADHHKEMVQQLVLKTEVIKDLRKDAKLAQMKVEEKSLVEQQLQETLRTLQEQIEKQNMELENQMITIGNLQQALVQSKRGIEGPAVAATVNGTISPTALPKQRLASHDVFDI